MKSILITILLCLICSTVYAYEQQTAGPYYIPAHQSKNVVIKTHTFTTEPTDQAFLIVKSINAKAEITLNAQVLVTTHSKYTDNKIKINVNLLDINTLDVAANGKPGTAVIVSIITEMPPVQQVSIECLVINKEFTNFIPATVCAHLVSSNIDIYGVSDNTTGCTFDVIPDEYVLISASNNNRKGAVLVHTDSERPTILAQLILYPQGDGVISGQTDPGAIVYLEMTNYQDIVISDESGSFAFVNIPVEGNEKFSLTTQILGSIKTDTIYGILSSDQPVGDVILTPTQPCPINSTWFNGDFYYGLSGWLYSGSVAIGPKDFFWGDTESSSASSLEAVLSASSSAAPQKKDKKVPPGKQEDTESPYTAILKGVYEEGTTKMTKAYIVPPNATKLIGHVRWLSEEWRYQRNFQILSYFSVKVLTPDKIYTLTEGTVATIPSMSGWVAIPTIGISDDIPVELDLTKYRGQPINLVFEISPGNSLDPVLMVRDFEILTVEGMFFLGNGIWDLPTSVSFQAGQCIEFKLSSPNTYPTLVNIRNHTTGEQKSAGVSSTDVTASTISFSCFGNEPMSWGFSINSGECLNNVVKWEAWSTWVPGMEPN